MKFSTYLQEQASNEIRRAFEDTSRYVKDVQKSELSLRDGIAYLSGRLKGEDKNLSALLDDILKNTK